MGLARGKIYPASAATHLLNPLRRLIQQPSRIAARLDLRPTDHVLELGCGPGYFSKSISQLITQGQLVMCDIQSEMLSMALTRTRDYATAVAVSADAQTLPFADRTFDAVVMSSVLGEVPDRAQCLRELRRVLKNSGAITVVETRRDSDFVPLTEVANLAAQADLVVTRTWGWRWEFTVRLSTC